jgi:hypothetical protein
MTTVMASSVETVEEVPARRSVWGALVAGAAVALACSVMLNLLGAAIGASMVDALDRDTPSAMTFSITAGVWMLLAALISYFLGGLVASRLSAASDPDVASMYGLAVWGIGILVSSFVVASSVLGAVGTAAQGAGQAASGVVQALGSAAAPAVNQLDPERLGNELRMRLRGGDVASMSQDDAGSEIGMLIARRVTDGSLPQGGPRSARAAHRTFRRRGRGPGPAACRSGRGRSDCPPACGRGEGARRRRHRGNGHRGRILLGLRRHRAQCRRRLHRRAHRHAHRRGDRSPLPSPGRRARLRRVEGSIEEART